MTIKLSNQGVPTESAGMLTDDLVQTFKSQRNPFERRWYDNNFFDDGYHFRYVSRTTGKIVDLSDRGMSSIPQRAIPKASRQIRGVANLLTGPSYTPSIYPEKIGYGLYQDPKQYEMAKQRAKEVAKRQGMWLENVWKEEELTDVKLVQMIILAAKHGVSFLQVWPDSIEEKINSMVLDAFDVYCNGSLDDVQKSPAVIKTMSRTLDEIKADELFEEDRVAMLTPDNKYANSEIKEAYMRSRFGRGTDSEMTSTVTQKEAFIKEYIGEHNQDLIGQYSPQVLEGKKAGDVVIRHVFSAGGITLKDEYLNLTKYPIVALQLEPGPLYQVPLIERFIPANKSLDIVASRVERMVNTMVSGMWLKRKGENFKISNLPGGQLVEYTSQPPVQAQMAPIPAYVFNYMDFLEKVIEEQGASTSALGQLPEGVKSGIAIESMKSTEYANLDIPSKMVKRAVRQISEVILEIGSQFIEPQTVMQPSDDSYFDVMGQRGIEAHQGLGIRIGDDVVPIKKDLKVDIEVSSGLGFTIEGKKQTMQQIAEYMRGLAQEGYLTKEAVNLTIEKLLETYQFGSTQEFMEALEDGQPTDAVNEDDLTKIKTAVAEVLLEAGVAGPDKEKQMIETTKVGVAQALHDSGIGGNNQPQEKKAPSQSMSFKDLPPSGKVQMAEQAGIQLNPMELVEEPENESVD